MAKLLVLGVGNMLLTDDGIGVFAAQELVKEQWPDTVTIMDGGTFTHDIFYYFEGYSHLLVLDIIHAGQEPGSIYRFTEERFVHNQEQRLSLHDIDLLDSLRMAEKLGFRPQLRFIGMEPHDYTTWNIGLSAITQGRFNAFLQVAREEIATILAEMKQ